MNNFQPRINKIGKVCRIISIVLMSLMIAGTALLLVGGIVLTALPTDILSVDVHGQAEVEISGRIADNVSEDQAKRIAEKVYDNSWSLSFEGEKVKDQQTGSDVILLHANGSLTQFNLRRVGVALIVSSLITGSLIAVFLMLSKLMKALALCTSPFSDEVARRMTNFAISLFPFSLIKPIASSIASSYLLTGRGLFQFGVDLTTVFTALVILLLVSIFKYGAKLQRESDETL